MEQKVIKLRKVHCATIAYSKNTGWSGARRNTCKRTQRLATFFGPKTVTFQGSLEKESSVNKQQTMYNIINQKVNLAMTWLYQLVASL